MTSMDMTSASIDQGPENQTTKRLATLEAQVGVLTAKDKSKTWYKDPSTVISFIALLTSVIGFAYSSFRDVDKDKAQKRADLQTAVTQLDALTTQWTQL